MNCSKLTQGAQPLCLSSIDELIKLSGPIVLAGGTFDGVHCGHQALIQRAQEVARSCGGQVVVMTFDRHPAALLRPEKAPRLLTTTPQKLRLLGQLGVEAVLLLRFDAALAAISAEQFIQSLVAAAHPLRAFCVGAGWSFGRGGEGNIALLQKLGEEFHFSVTEIDPIKVKDTIVSSTRIRELIAHGRLEEAIECLGHSYTLSGKVVNGVGLGKKLGFPTANLFCPSAQLPPNGVYAVKVIFQHEEFQGVVNIGVRPTIAPQSSERVVEVHLLDFSRDLYDQEITIEFVEFIREEKKFLNLEALKEQIHSDVLKVRKMMG